MILIQVLKEASKLSRSYPIAGKEASYLQRRRHGNQLPGRGQREHPRRVAGSRRGRFVLATKYTVSRDGSDPNAAGSHRNSPREHTAARAIQEVADELGVTAAQVAIAWIRARSRAVHPIIGASRVEQLEDNLGAIDVVLPDEAIQQLAAAVGFTAGFPTDFIAEASQWVFGDASTRLDGRTR